MRTGILLCLLMNAADPMTASTAHLINDRKAQELTREAVAVLGIDAKVMVLVPYADDHAPEFYSFEVFRRGSSANGHVGYFAVNRWTGDVWNIDGCSRIASPVLSKEQESILKRSGMSPSEAAALGAKPPGCQPSPPR